MIDKAREADLFEGLSRNQAFREWLQDALDTDITILIQNMDAVQLHRAQGRSQLLRRLLDLSNKK